MRSQSLEIYGWRLSRSARTGDRCRTDGIQSSEALRATPNGRGWAGLASTANRERKPRTKHPKRSERQRGRQELERLRR